MTNEELDKARAEEAWRLWMGRQEADPRPPVIAARLARENWTPPEPVVDPDVKLAMTIARNKHSELADVRAVEATAASVLAGIKAGREQEQERAKVLVEYAEGEVNRGDGAGMRATLAMAAYRAGRAAR
jgi:hypothetical protein